MTAPRHPLWHALAFGLLAGALGTAWILKDFTRKAYALGYHVPLAIVFTTALVDVTFTALDTRRHVYHFWQGAFKTRTDPTNERRGRYAA
jgi:hypothetical protein